MKLPYPVEPELLIEYVAFYSCIPIDILDSSGRPLLEGRSVYFNPSSTEYKVCKYSGSRYKNSFPLNTGALKQAVKQFSNVEQLFCKYISLSTDIVTLNEKVSKRSRIYAVAMTGLKTPNYLLAKKYVANLELEISETTSVMSKICHGLTSMVLASEKDQIDRAIEDGTESLYAYVDHNNLFIGGRTKEVCGGAPHLVKKVFDLFQVDEISKGVIGSDLVNKFRYAGLISLFEAASFLYKSYVVMQRNDCSAIQDKDRLLTYYQEVASEHTNQSGAFLEQLKSCMWAHRLDADVFDKVSRFIKGFDALESDPRKEFVNIFDVINSRMAVLILKNHKVVSLNYNLDFFY